MKIERAKTHLSELEGECNTFHGTQPYRIVCDEDTDAGKLIFKVDSVECTPPVMSAIIGDVIHNLRSALDLLATELAIAGGGSGKYAKFPFNADPSKFETKWLQGRMRGADKRALRFVKRLKPHPGGNETLWKIHQLDILDKHKAIIPVGAAYASVDPDPASMLPSDAPPGLKAFMASVNIAIRPADREYPLKDGTVLYSCPIPKAGDPKPDPKFAIEIAFGEGQIVDGEPVVPALKQFIDLIERITNIAQRYFF